MDNGQEVLIYQNPGQVYQNTQQYNPYENSQIQTQNPYFPSITTTQRYIFSPVSSTRSPYDFNNFPTQKQYENSFLGNYFSTLRKTTKSPYDFANFGRTTQNPFSQNFNDHIDNNYLKRSYNIASYYSDSSNLNKTVVNGKHSK